MVVQDGWQNQYSRSAEQLIVLNFHNSRRNVHLQPFFLDELADSSLGIELEHEWGEGG